MPVEPVVFGLAGNLFIIRQIFFQRLPFAFFVINKTLTLNFVLMMNYSVNDLLNGAQVMASSVFGRRREYNLQFNHEDDGCWYVNFPGWPFDHHNLMMVAGADDLCAFLSDDDKFAYVDVVPSNRRLEKPGYACLVQGEHSLTGGSTYTVTDLPGFDREIWLCPVTLFVLGRYPKYIYIKKGNR